MNKALLIWALALHTVTRADALGGTISHPRGNLFQVDEAELDRLRRHGAARRATDAEVAQAKKGVAVTVNEPVAGRSYSESEEAARRAASAGAALGDVADEDDGLDLGDKEGEPALAPKEGKTAAAAAPRKGK